MVTFHLTPTTHTAGVAIFGCAFLHLLIAPWFSKLATQFTRRAWLFYYLGEAELVFGIWSVLFLILVLMIDGYTNTVHYIQSRSFNEPLFVFVMMLISASRPILQLLQQGLSQISRLLPLPYPLTFYWSVLTLVPIAGSWITESAAMILASIILSQQFFQHKLSGRFKYGTLAVLLVNVSIGGTLTAFAAPAILMVAKDWHWDNTFMAYTFGWKAAVAIMLNSCLATFFFRHELLVLPMNTGAYTHQTTQNIPPHYDIQAFIQLVLKSILTFSHLILMFVVVYYSHQPILLLGLLGLFLLLAYTYPTHQDKLILREAALVACFLSGLIILGEPQKIGLQSVFNTLSSTSSDTIFLSAIFLTAFIDNTALTYLASLTHDLPEHFKYALLAGALSGGGLTVIANAPNIAAIAVLKPYFDAQEIRAKPLLLAALLPTLIAAAAFRFL
jgi:hypothetical protein